MRKIEVYDIETIAGVFSYVGYNIDSNELNTFIIHESKNQLNELVSHILSLSGMIGYNNLGFDYPILHYIIKNYENWQSWSNRDVISAIYNKAQEIIESQSFDTRFSHNIKTKDILVEQLDLFKIWHFDNQAKLTSLKALEISMNYPNVMEMNMPHNTLYVTDEQVEELLKYNINDVLATHAFYLLSKDKINLRLQLKEKYKLDCLNYSDSKIGEELVLDLYAKATKQNKWDIKKAGGTNNDVIHLKDCIFDYIQFKTPIFNRLLNDLKSKFVKTTKDKIDTSVIYKGFKYDYGLGGIHGSIKAGVYESDDDYIIVDADVASLYPSIAVINNLYPSHLGSKFCEVYKDILDQRIKAKKEGFMTVSDGLKLSLNSVYGKSNDKFSFLRDSLYTLKTTINGQLMLTMLCEDLVENIEDLTMLQINTDGLSIKIRRSDYNKYFEICKNWEEKTKLTLEYVEYSKMIISDVNNYISLSTKNKVKYKGKYEIEKELHKDNSDKIVAIALSEYFINNIPVEDTIRNHKNIYDFCARQKFTGKNYGVTHTLSYDEDGIPFDKIERQQKNVRYYISNKGSTFIKHYEDESTEVINKGYQITVFNNYVEKNMEDYSINYQYYIKETNKIINTIVSNQMQLF